ncbi:hypothetical protein [Pedobacter aquatilis]|uniref:hypothetical protein n=1 Tax=Pedobacter aquatilis TaxID=351343 RepID=UPI002930A8ED|nr:hypothetical protein [Pedobacter aquatilis]
MTGRSKELKIVLILSFSVVLISLVFTYVIGQTYPKLEERAQFGDSFGALNALFSVMAFISVIFTVSQQIKELGLQRQQLAQQKKEFIITRITSIAYNQVEKFDRIFENAEFSYYFRHQEKKESGKKAMVQINRSIESLIKSITRAENIRLQDFTNPYNALGFVASANIDELEICISVINAGYSLIQRATASEEFQQQDIDEILNIYWSNLDIAFIEFLRLFYKQILRYKEDISSHKTDERKAVDRFLGIFESSKLFLHSNIDFKALTTN